MWHDFTAEENDTMISPINFKMAAHPMNWLTIMLMVIIAGAIGHYILSYFGIEANIGQSAAPSNGQVPMSSVASSLPVTPSM